MGRFSKLETQEAQLPEAVEERKPKKEYGEPPLSFESVMRTADVHFYSGEWKKAIREYSRAIQLDSKQVAPWSGQVLALLFMGQAREADVWARRALDCFPEHPVAISLRGLAFSLQGMAKRGLGSSDYAMGLGAEHPMAWIARGWILLESDNKNWSECFLKVGEMSGGDGWRNLMLMGLILERYKKWPRAAEYYQKAVAMQSGNYYLWFRLGRCYKKLGLGQKAREAFEHVISLNPHFSDAQQELRRINGFFPLAVLRRVFRVFKK